MGPRCPILGIHGYVNLWCLYEMTLGVGGRLLVGP